ncbi:MAG: PEP-CTERM sorting domain-containing protein [Verrucomicrobiales bacterium]
MDALPAGNSSSKALKVSWAFAENVTAPWLRLTTSSAPAVPNPTIDLTKNLRFDIWSDRDVKLALGVRETGTSAEIGANGGAAGTIEWVGVTGVSEGAPLPIRTILANQWTTVYFNVDGELSAGFTGNGSVSSATGKGVLEHLALVPLAGHSGEYNIYLDNFEVTAVPEPSTYAMIFGLAALTGGMYFRKKRAA